MKYSESITALKYERENRFALIGSEQFLKESFIKKAKSILLNHDIEEFWPEQSSEACSCLQSGTLFSKQFVILHDFDKMNIKDFLDMNNVNGIIIYSISEKANIKNREMSKILCKTTIVECDKFKEYGPEYPLWISRYINEAGYITQEGVSDLIYSKVGPNLYQLSKEINKLFMVKADGAITLNDIEKYVSKLSIGTSFDLLESLLKRDIKKALIDFESLSKIQDNFIDIVGFIGSYLEKLFRVFLLHEKNIDPKDIADIVGLPHFLLKTKYLPRIIPLGKNFFVIKMSELCNVDVSLRLFKGDKRIIMEKFIMSFK